MAARSNQRLGQIEEEITGINAKLEELRTRRRELVSQRQKSTAGVQPTEPPQPESSYAPSSGPPTSSLDRAHSGPGLPLSAKGSGTGQAAGPSAGTGTPGESFF